MLRANRGKGPARLVLVPGAERFDYAVRGYEVHISHRGRGRRGGLSALPHNRVDHRPAGNPCRNLGGFF